MFATISTRKNVICYQLQEVVAAALFASIAGAMKYESTQGSMRWDTHF
jgi:hypothetical protein